MIKALIPAALAALTLSACVTTDPTPPAAVETSAALPPVWPRSPGLEAQWGPPSGPSMQLDGHQGIEYSNPAKRGDYATVVYEGRTKPRDIRNADGTLASDGKMTIMGQTVDFYGSGNEDAAISTQPMPLTFPDGTTGWFTFTFAAPEHLKGKNIPAFTW